MATQVVRTAADPAKTEAFVGKVLTDTTGFAVTVLSSIGDRLGLWKELAANGAVTSDELATRARVDERYAREWLAAMASAGYLAYDAGTRRFVLPVEHIPALADEGGPMFFGGVQQEFVGFLPTLGGVVNAFRHGGGVGPQEYPDDMWEGISRFTAGWFNNLLVQQWIPAVPDVEAKLEHGVDVADIGCGYGNALIRLAQTYPNSRFTGYDVLDSAIARASASAAAAGVSDRVRFVSRDVSHGLPDTYDVITTFDVVHDSTDPLGLLRAIRDALRTDGTYVCLDINCSPNLEENIGPLGALFYSCSVLFCMTVSLARDGAGLGTMGLSEEKLRELATIAGFGAVRRLPIDNPFNSLYEIKPTVAGL